MGLTSLGGFPADALSEQWTNSQVKVKFIVLVLKGIKRTNHLSGSVIGEEELQNEF